MGNSLREVKEKISATKSTMQITKAMHLVSQSKVKKAQKAYVEYNNYLVDLREKISLMLSNIGAEYSNSYLENNNVDDALYILVTSDRGLAGAYNANVYKKFKELTSSIDKNSIYTASLGRLGYSYLKRNSFNVILNRPILVRDDLMFIDIDPLFKVLDTAFVKNKLFGKVYVIYNHFVNSLSSEVRVEQIIPVNKESILKSDSNNVNYNFEIGLDDTVDEILPIYIEDMLFGIILDAKTSEHMARMNSMKNATDNATEIIKKLDLLYNRARQSNITNELIDIVNGSTIGGE